MLTLDELNLKERQRVYIHLLLAYGSALKLLQDVPAVTRLFLDQTYWNTPILACSHSKVTQACNTEHLKANKLTCKLATNQLCYDHAAYTLIDLK